MLIVCFDVEKVNLYFTWTTRTSQLSRLGSEPTASKMKNTSNTPLVSNSSTLLSREQDNTCHVVTSIVRQFSYIGYIVSHCIAFPDTKVSSNSIIES